MQDPALRNKITWYSFFFSLLVVWIHAYNAELFLGSGAEQSFCGLVEEFLGERVGQIAVPGFFMLSGYLFFCDFDWGKLRGKWTRRIYSVLVPYILWNGIYYAGYVIGSRLPWMRHVVGKGTIPLSLNELTEAILYYKYNPVFWYMYQLIFLILLAPVLYAVLKQTWSAVLWFALLTLALFIGLELPLLNVDALLYYSAAAAAAIRLQHTKMPAPSCRIGILLLALSILSYETGLALAMPPLFVLCRLLAVTSLWLLIPARILPPARDIIRHSFFLYATHFALVRFINKAAAQHLTPHPAIPLTLYLLMPLLTLLLSTTTHHHLRRHLPSLAIILNGGR